MNFIEAALLIQGSACVYSKKVGVSLVLPLSPQALSLVQTDQWVWLYLFPGSSAPPFYHIGPTEEAPKGTGAELAAQTRLSPGERT